MAVPVFLGTTRCIGSTCLLNGTACGRSGIQQCGSYVARQLTVGDIEVARLTSQLEPLARERSTVMNRDLPQRLHDLLRTGSRRPALLLISHNGHQPLLQLARTCFLLGPIGTSCGMRRRERRRRTAHDATGHRARARACCRFIVRELLPLALVPRSFMPRASVRPSETGMPSRMPWLSNVRFSFVASSLI